MTLTKQVETYLIYVCNKPAVIKVLSPETYQPLCPYTSDQCNPNLLEFQAIPYENSQKDSQITEMTLAANYALH
jgi:hypothetical protein